MINVFLGKMGWEMGCWVKGKEKAFLGGG